MVNVSNNNPNEPKYYEYGIDLGTTNSCIAKAEEKEMRIYQTKENTNTTRSAVYINKNGKRFIGQQAYYAQVNDRDNVALEFKRLMGTSDKIYFPSSDTSLTPVELSAEILKSLKSDVKRLSDEDVRYVVITVPAAFGTLQCEATYQSAKLAGFEKLHLLQEPIAAAIAYGASPNSKNKNWMVYDFGGGTFDVAIVSTKNNRLTVLNNEGNNLLGGKDIDSIIVENLFLPAVNNEFTLFPPNTDEYYKLYAKLQRLAEDIKIELSTLTETTVCLDSNTFGTDADGEDIDMEFGIKREDLELHLEEIINETITLSKAALKGAALSGPDIDSIVLVGGSTQIPMVRNKLYENFDCKQVLAKDPIGIVAKGAAMYAAITEVEQNVEATELVRGSVSANLQYDRVTSQSITVLNGRILGDMKIAEIKIETKDGIWDSGWFGFKDIENSYFEAELTLQKNKKNCFNLRCRDKMGNEIKIAESSFVITQKEDHLEFAKPLVTSSLCIEYIDNQGNKKLEPIIRKNTPLAAFGSCTFNTSKELKKGDVGNSIAIKLWEGEDYDEPDANVWIANIYIKEDDLKRTLLKGTEIEVSIEVNESRLIVMGANVPTHNLVIGHEAVYTPKPVNVEDHFGAIREEIENYYERLDYIESKIPRPDEEARKKLNDLREQVDAFNSEYENAHDTASYEKDKALKIIDKAKAVRKAFSVLEKELFLEKLGLTLEKEAFNVINRVDYTVNTYGNSQDISDLNKLKNEIQEAIEFKDRRGVNYGIQKLGESEFRILSQQYDLWLQMFLYLDSGEIKFVDQDQAYNLIIVGRKAAEKEDLVELRRVVFELIMLTEKSIEHIIQESIVNPGLNKH